MQSDTILMPAFPQPPANRRSVCGASTAFPEATEVAIEILRAGGNAIDAAVAAAWALSVCEPASSGLGGQTTMLIHFAGGTDRVVDGHSHAPATASLHTIGVAQQKIGHRACTIPSTPATLDHAQRHYGCLPAAWVIEPAIRIAEEGFTVTPLQHRQTVWVHKLLAADEASARFFLDRRLPPRPGFRLRQPKLARTLRRIASHGAQDFYQGEMAGAIARDMQVHGGLITEDDLRSFALPVEREPLAGSYRGLRVLTVPPPGGGRQLLLSLQILEMLLTDGRSSDRDWYEAIALAVYTALRDCEQSAGWTAEIEQYLALLAMEARNRGVLPDLSLAPAAGETTHLNVADRHGNIVALTQSIQSLFGAKVANRDLGFVYNNYLCTTSRDALAPRCVPPSNVAPTLVMGGGPGGSVPLLALGAAGSCITSSILQVISGVVDGHRRVDEAVAAPRLHVRQSRIVWLEENAARDEVVSRLQSHFPALELQSQHDYKLGCVQALQWTSRASLAGAADPRRDGTARIC